MTDSNAHAQEDSHDGQSSVLDAILGEMTSTINFVSECVDKLSDMVYSSRPLEKESRGPDLGQTLWLYPVGQTRIHQRNCAELSHCQRTMKLSCRWPSLSNVERRKIRSSFPMPDTPVTRCLDPTFKVHSVKADAELPLDVDNGPSQKLSSCWAMQLSRLRRKKVLKAVNPDIQDLADDEESVAPNLFGSQKMKERAESLKLLSAAKPPVPKKFFPQELPLCPPKRQWPAEVDPRKSLNLRTLLFYQAETYTF